MERRAEEQRLAVLDPLAKAVVEVVVVAVEPVAGVQSDFHFHQLNRMLLKNNWIMSRSPKQVCSYLI